MGIEIATAVHIPLILRLLAATPNPPLDTEETIQAILGDRSQFTLIDPAVPVFVRMAPRPDLLDDDGKPAPDVIVPWWVWEGDFRAAHLPIVGMVARAVKRAFPAAGPWLLRGAFPGEGDTEAERKADSERQAKEHLAWLPSLAVEASPENAKMWQGRATIDDVIAAIPAVAP